MYSAHASMPKVVRGNNDVARYDRDDEREILFADTTDNVMQNDYFPSSFPFILSFSTFFSSGMQVTAK